MTAVWYQTPIGDVVTGLAALGCVAAVVMFLRPFPGRGRR